MRGKSEVFIVHVTRPLPCWVRSPGRSKVPNKSIYFGCWRGDGTGQNPRLSSLRVCVLFFIFFLFFPCSCVQQLCVVSGYLSLKRPCDYCCVF
ncbi:hypothetical protein A4A49_13666 [Nicotiana attenuata]|uniref:Uncharacterized protein n=1 Tax=Nicotiana attenuata TaxID=49451 RepID=A0A1J6IG70_NICAT|nr:hypothetical protein A4A49_13666 [Nicotiana attenuata]